MRLAIDIRTLYTFKNRGLGAGLMMTLEGLGADPSDNEYLLLVDRFTYANGTADLVRSRPQLGKLLRDPRFSVRQVPGFSSVLGAFEFTWEQLKLWRRFRLPPRTLFYSYNYLAPLLTRVPWAIHVPDTFAKDMEGIHTKDELRVLDWGGVCVKEAGCITTYTENSKQSIMNHYGVPPERISVVHEAVSGDTFYRMDAREREQERARLGLPRRFILCVGVVEPRKNMARVVRALKIYNDTHDEPLSLVIVGEMSQHQGELYREVTDEVRRLDLCREVVFAGTIYPPTLTKIYNCAEALIFPSICEGFGIPPIESMLCGTPAVVSDASAMPEVTDGAAVLVDPLDVSSIAAGITEAVDDQARRAELTARGREVAERYSLGNRTRRLLGALESYHSEVCN